MDPETVSPPADVDLDDIAADLAAVETALHELDAGTYRHDRPAPRGPSTTGPADPDPQTS